MALRVGCYEATLFTRGERSGLNQLADLMGDIMGRQAQAQGIHYADVIPAFEGHRICDGTIGTGGEWLSGL